MTKISNMKGVRPAHGIPQGVPTRFYLNQAAPVANTWYPVVVNARNARLICLGFNVQTAGEDLELAITVNGVQMVTENQAAVAGTDYTVCWNASAVQYGSDLTEVASADADRLGRAFLLEARTLSISIRKTSAAGAGNLRCMGVLQTL